MIPEIKAILEDNEEVIWDGKQDLKSTMLSSLFGSIVVILAAFLFYKGISPDIGTCTINGAEASYAQCEGLFQYFGWGLIALALAMPTIAYLNYLVTHYLITKKRVIIKSGLIGADMRSIYYDQMKSAFVNVGIVGKIFGTGTIMIDTGRMTATKKGSKTAYDRLKHINDPYGIYKTFQDRLSNRKEGLHSGRADHESNREEYKEFIQDSERMKKDV